MFIFFLFTHVYIIQKETITEIDVHFRNICKDNTFNFARYKFYFFLISPPYVVLFSHFLPSTKRGESPL